MGTSGRASIHRRLYSSARTRVSRQYMLAYADLSGRSHAHSEHKSHRGCVISTRHDHAPPRRSIAPAARRHAHASARSQEYSSRESRPSGKSVLVTRRLPGSTPAYWPTVPHSAPGWRFPRALLACRAAPARYSGRTWERHSGRAMGAAFTRPTGIAFGSAHAHVDGVGQFNCRSARPSGTTRG